MGDGWYPGAIRTPLTTGEFSERDHEIWSVAEHVSDGTDSRNWLQHAQNESSVHFLVRIEDGKAVTRQFLSIWLAAWGNGRHSGKTNPYMPGWVKGLIDRNININRATISVEHERKWPFKTPFDKRLIEESVRLHRWLAVEVPTLRTTREFTIGHFQIDHENRAFCPGGPGGELFFFDRLISEMQDARRPAPSPNLEEPVTLNGFVLQGPLRRFWLEHQGLRYFGLPIRPQEVWKLPDGPPGKSWEGQLFERSLLHYDPQDPSRTVHIARAGAMIDALLK